MHSSKQEQGKLEEDRHLEALSTSLESAPPLFKSFTERKSAGELHVYYVGKDISSVLRATLISHLSLPAELAAGGRAARNKSTVDHFAFCISPVFLLETQTLNELL